jgi:hypothetical protein
MLQLDLGSCVTAGLHLLRSYRHRGTVCGNEYQLWDGTGLVAAALAIDATELIAVA